MNEDLLKLVADNQALQDALHTLLVRSFEPPKLIGSLEATTDEVLGQQTRARFTGLMAIEDAFRELQRYKTIPDRPDGVNPAR